MGNSIHSSSSLNSSLRGSLRHKWDLATVTNRLLITRPFPGNPCWLSLGGKKVYQVLFTFYWLVKPSNKNPMNIWSVVSTPLKNISLLGWLFPTYGKIKNVPDHQPEIRWTVPILTSTASMLAVGIKDSSSTPPGGTLRAMGSMALFPCAGATDMEIWSYIVLQCITCYCWIDIYIYICYWIPNH